MSTPPSPTSFWIDTSVLLVIQGGYYLLARRFLRYALPTLRELSKQSSLSSVDQHNGGGGGHDDRIQEVGLLGLPRLKQDVSTADGSSLVSPSTRISSSRSNTQRGLSADLGDSDSDSVYSMGTHSPSPGPSTRPSIDAVPLLPLHSSSQETSSAATHQRTASQHAPPSDHKSSSSLHPKKVLKLFHGKKAHSHRHQNQGQQARTTRGLGWVAGNLFSLAFSECLLLLSLVMFHSVGVFESR